MILRARSPAGVLALGCGILPILAIWPACACLPTAYREVEVARLPEAVREEARKVEPGILPRRAWAFWIGGRIRDRGEDGYLIRGRRPESWWDKDFKVHVGTVGVDREPIDLRPID